VAPRTAQVASLLLLEGTVPLQPSAGDTASYFDVELFKRPSKL
jgi:hypothetical protein